MDIVCLKDSVYNRLSLLLFCVIIIKNHDLFMFNTEEIQILRNAHHNSYDSYEDFELRKYFKNISGSENHKYNVSFDNYFTELDNVYNNLKGHSYMVSQQMNEIKKMHTAIDFNDFKSVEDILYKMNSMKEIIRSLNRLTSRSILEDLATNYYGWTAIAELQGVNISTHLDNINELRLAIKNDDIITPILTKIEKLQTNLGELSYDLKIVNTNNPTELEKSTYMESCFNLKRSLAFFEKYYNQDNFLNNLIKESNLFEHINHYKVIRKEIVDTLIQNNPDFTYSCAHKFVNFMNRASDVELMLLDRAGTDLKSINRIRDEMNIDDKSHPVCKINFFDDNSIAIQKNSGEWINVNSKELKDSFIEKLMQKELFNKLKKSPTIAKMFVSKLQEDFDDCQLAFTAANTYVEHEAILKSKNYNLLEEIDDLLFEDLDDSMNAYVRKHKIHQYGLSISSKKYQHLYDDSSFEILGLLYDLKIPANELQESLGKKLAAFKTSDDFNKGLRQLYSIHSGFSTAAVLKKADRLNAEVIKNHDNMLILKIDNFSQSSAIGSSSWCIVRDEVHFNSYKEDCHQYFIYDFNKDPVHNDSLIGITLRKDGSHSAAHLKNDEQLHNKDIFQQLQVEIIRNDLTSYPALNEELKAKIDSTADAKKQSLLKNITSKLFNR